MLSKVSYSGNDYVTKDIFQFIPCTSCSGFSTTIPETVNIGDYYGQKYYRNEKGKFIPGVNELFLYQHKRTAKKLFERWDQPKIVVDIGCGQGVLMESLSQLGVKTYGVEHDEASYWVLENPNVHIETHSKFYSGTGKQLKSKVDLVIFWHVLEHLENPVKALQEVYQLLDENGKLCISVPNIGSWQAKIGYKYWFHLDVPRHLFHFTPDALEQLLTSNKFEILKKDAGDWYHNLFGWFQSLANAFSGLITRKCDNAVYKVMQNQHPTTATDFIALVIQVLSFPLWLPLGLIGFSLEMLFGKTGTMTFFAKKKS